MEPDLTPILYASPLLDHIAENILPANSATQKDLMKLQHDAGLQFQAFTERKNVAELFSNTDDVREMIESYTPVTAQRLNKVLLNTNMLIPADSELKGEFEMLLGEMDINKTNNSERKL